MEKNMKIILIAVVAVILLALVGGYLLFTNTDITLVGMGSEVTVPAYYELDEAKALATNDDVIILFNGIMGSVNETTEFYKAISANGNASGYKNVTEDTINAYKVYEYEADPHNLTLVKYGSSTQWYEYPPEDIIDGSGSKIDTNHYRKIYYISPNNSVANELTIIAKNPNADLHSKEIEDIIHSIKATEV